MFWLRNEKKNLGYTLTTKGLKVRTSIKIFCVLSLPIIFANSFDPIRPNNLSGLIWIQTIQHFDAVSERIFLKRYLILKKKQQMTKKHAKIAIILRLNLCVLDNA